VGWQPFVIRIRIVQEPTTVGIDGIRLDSYRVGEEYEVGNTIASLFLAEGWAVPVPLDALPEPLPFTEGDPYDTRKLYLNLPQNRTPRLVDRGVAADFPRRKRKRRKA
jgi:hypothetical protein